MCVSHEQRVQLITVGPKHVLDLMTTPLYLLSSGDSYDKFKTLKNTSQDATRDKIAKELGLVPGNG